MVRAAGQGGSEEVKVIVGGQTVAVFAALGLNRGGLQTSHHEGSSLKSTGSEIKELSRHRHKSALVGAC
jgi:hypothetical protein